MNKTNRKLMVVACIMLVAFSALFVVLQTPSQQYRQQLTIGQRFLRTKDYPRAEAAFRSAIRILPKKKEAYEGVVATYMNQADEFAATDPKKAENCYRKADSYVQEAKKAGAGEIKLNDYGTYSSSTDDNSPISSGTSADSVEEASADSSTDSGMNDSSPTEQVDYVSLGKEAIEDAKTRYQEENGESWYQPTGGGSYDSLSATERHNMKVIQDYQNSHGLNTNE